MDIKRQPGMGTDPPIGGDHLKVCGAISLVGLIFPRLAIWFLLIPLLGAAFGLIIYSYLYYRSLHKGMA